MSAHLWSIPIKKYFSFSSIKDLTRDSRELRFSGSFKIFIMVEVVYPIMHAQKI